MRKAKLLLAPIIALTLSSCATGVHHSIEEYFVKSLLVTIPKGNT